MTILLTHISALWLLRRQKLGERVGRGERCTIDIPDEPRDAATVEKLLTDIPAIADIGLEPRFLVGSTAGARHGAGYTCKAWTGLLPPNSAVRIARGVYCASPELVAVQMAPDLTFIELVVLLGELMGLYTIAPWEQRGMIQRELPLTTPERIAEFLDAAGPARGVKLVRRALAVAVVGSASPRETKLSLRLGLKPALGGYGLEVLSMNEPLEVESIGAHFDKKGIRRPDILIKAVEKGRAAGEFTGVAFEYDGSDHLTPARQAADARRGNELKALGLKEYQINAELYRDINYMDGIVEQARRDAGYPRRHISAEKACDLRKKRLALYLDLERAGGITWSGVA